MYRKLLISSLVLLSASCISAEEHVLARGPMLGGVTDTYAGIWGATNEPATITVILKTADGKEVDRKDFTTTEADYFLFTARFNGLTPDTEYSYTVMNGDRVESHPFRTFGPSMSGKPLRIVYGSCYLPSEVDPALPPLFPEMAKRKADMLIFSGDFPYTKQGELKELRENHKTIRETVGFADMVCETPTYAIWDDHEFGPNDCDGTHPFVAEAVQGFQEHWPNPAYGYDAGGCFFETRAGDVDVFFIDNRYHRRQVKEGKSIMLGEQQTAWLKKGLLESDARYKLIVCGVQWGRKKWDSWGGAIHIDERNALFDFIKKNKIHGVMLTSGDVHRSEVWKFPLKKNWGLYDFTSSALARKSRVLEKRLWPEELIYSHSVNGMFCELDFLPENDARAAVIFRILEPDDGVVYELTVKDEELGY